MRQIEVHVEPMPSQFQTAWIHFVSFKKSIRKLNMLHHSNYGLKNTAGNIQIPDVTRLKRW